MDTTTNEQTGAELIAAERLRQISAEGFNIAHDDDRDRGEMLQAALSYIMQADGQGRRISFPPCFIPKFWPWERRWWKPSADPVRNLVKAGALIAAEIDRLNRKATRG
jgi:hypothetical protein